MLAFAIAWLPVGWSANADALDGPSIRFSYLVYFADVDQALVLADLARHAQLAGSPLRQVAALPETLHDAVVKATWISDVRGDARPPDRGDLQYLRRGIDETQATALGRSSQALALDFAHPRAVAFTALANADALVSALVEAREGFAYDVSLGRVIGPQRWRRERLHKQAQARPNVMNHVAVHAYRDGDWIRAVTVGMGKFGLPDLVIDELAATKGTQLVWMINATAQRMLEGQRPAPGGSFALDFAQVADPAVREAALGVSMSNASGRAELRLIETPVEEGDNPNTLLAIRFGGYEGPDEFARQDAAVSAMFGWSDAVMRVRHDDALEAASQSAREKLPMLRAAIQRGLAPGELIPVKLPFATAAGGTEWMWVEVSRCNDDKIEGVLSYEPFDVPYLHAGQKVTGNANDVFDDIYERADGTREGNETSAIIMRMQTETEQRGGE